MILGVTGFFCAGKDTVAEVLAEKGFAHISLSDLIRRDLEQSGKEITIGSLTERGNQLRTEHGPGILGEMALDALDTSRNWVVTSIRHPAEVTALRRRPDFVLLFVDADQRVRYERSLLRSRSGDPQSFDQFAAEEERQAQSATGDSAAQALLACRDLATETISNDRTPDDLRENLTKLVSYHLRAHFLPRPEWDEYFMMVAEVAASRSNCIKRRVGAVIVHNRQILSTGYNGTPKGIKNCSEGGCPRCAGGGNSGSGLGECLCVHAEENAIVQAAAYGVAIREGTLYCTLCPCSYCAKSIINAGIKEVVFAGSYAMDEVAQNLFKEAGVLLRQLTDPSVSVRLKFAPPMDVDPN